jgi:2-amino-4-hydroxy-6-hydroxymethyldihydropteridine diphosphokinase
VIICYISLGSNLAKPLEQLVKSVNALKQHRAMTKIKVSSFYQSSALILAGSSAQNDYINAVVQLQTSLSASQLLVELHNIEASQGRKRTVNSEKWAARPLDLDILLYGQKQINTTHLVIPHLQIQHRNFVIHPLFEIAGAIDIPNVGNLADLAQCTPWKNLLKINEQ